MGLASKGDSRSEKSTRVLQMNQAKEHEQQEQENGKKDAFAQCPCVPLSSYARQSPSKPVQEGRPQS